MNPTISKKLVTTLLLLLLEISLIISICFLSQTVSMGTFASDIKPAATPTLLIGLLSTPVVAFSASGMALSAWVCTLFFAKKSTWFDQNLSAHGWLVLFLAATLGLFIYTFASPILASA